MSTPSYSAATMNGRRLVVGVRRTRADAGDEGAFACEDPAVPVGLRPTREGHDRRAGVQRPLGQHQRVGAHQHAVLVGVAIAGAKFPGFDAAQDGTGVTAHDSGVFARAELVGTVGRGGTAAASGVAVSIGMAGMSGGVSGAVGARGAGAATAGTVLSFGTVAASGPRGLSHEILLLRELRGRGVGGAAAGNALGSRCMRLAKPLRPLWPV